MPRYDALPRFPLLEAPTPLQCMPNLQKAIGSGPLLIKRDDLTPLGMGGNKARKLEYLLADALAQGAKTLVTVGGVQTNHGRLTAAAAVKAGLACTLILEGDKPAQPTGNLMLDCLLGAQLVFTNGRSVSNVAEKTLQQLAQTGGAPYFIPEGGSNALGSMGYLQMIPELQRQIDALQIPVRRLVCAVGSLGTYAGLWLGARVFDAPFEVVGVAVNPHTSATPAKAVALIEEMCARYECDICVRENDIHIIYADETHDFAGDGYNVPDRNTRSAISLLARTEAIFSDPCYTGKALRGFLHLACMHTQAQGADIFLHTGGAPALWSAEHLCGFSQDWNW